MSEWTGMLCLGGILGAPVLMFVVGFLAGRNRLPFTVKIERNRRAEYVLESDTPHEI